MCDNLRLSDVRDQEVNLLWVMSGRGVPMKPMNVKVKVPGPGYLASFEVKHGRKRYLILDSYGNETICGTNLEKRLYHDVPYTIAIDLSYKETKPCEVFLVGIYHDEEYGGKLALQLANFDKPYLLSAKYRSYVEDRLGLRSKKRPWRLTFDDRTFAMLDDRQIGYERLEEGLIIAFDGPDDTEVQVWGEDNREVSDWK